MVRSGDHPTRRPCGSPMVSNIIKPNTQLSSIGCLFPYCGGVVFRKLSWVMFFDMGALTWPKLGYVKSDLTKHINPKLLHANEVHKMNQLRILNSKYHYNLSKFH
jgi:hypothetical protein